MVEYFDDRETAIKRFTVGYGDFLKEIDEACKVESCKIMYSGFPAMMDGPTLQKSFEEFGPVKEFSLDPVITDTLSGFVVFETLDRAKAAVKQYDGVDMGMGKNLSLKM